MSLFSGLEKIGLGKMSNVDVFESEEEKKRKDASNNKAEVHVLTEEEVIFDKTYKCPVCDREFKSKTIRSGKVKLQSIDTDLRPKYQTVDCIKYDCIVCNFCGYAALSRYFNNVTIAQGKLIKQEITPSFKDISGENPIYSYEYAVLRYQLALANAVVKKAKMSERAYICLKIAWLLRGMSENLDIADVEYESKKQELASEEQNFIEKAYEGFKGAMAKEMFPICGMDEFTFSYVTADLARKCKDYPVSAKLLSDIIVSRGANNKVKDRARDLKEIIKEEMKAMKN